MAKKVNTPISEEKNILVEKRSRINQTDVPSVTLEKALSVSKAIFDNYGSKPTKPLQVAKALDLSPTSSGFRMLCGASIAYGLTSGGYNAQEISVENLSRRILKPTIEGDDKIAKIEAFLKPKVIGDFFSKYEGSPIPRADIAKNVLEDMGVPKDKTKDVFEIILSQGEQLGIILDLKSKKYVDLTNKTNHSNKIEIEEVEEKDENQQNQFIGNPNSQKIENKTEQIISQTPEKFRRVFITHGKNVKFVETIKKLLNFGELQPVVSVEITTVSQPVPDKVMNDMRSCGAAIIHVENEQKLLDTNANEVKLINSNVLIEIGAAMALYGRRFILLVREGVQLPSNLQGLFEVRYNGDNLDGEATIKLLEAINDMKNQALPK